ncbi:hypothetical protein I3843_01G109400 [Carya illinoinensis]|uniref:RIN4 pathogenic type III effector avirulence factor Avr cleavage site domain-containing protein n=1 Tax=Carya illinoinensis TaxID=32201 RepID=A0A8T1RN15_CARIL|nr:protein NOI4-like isoform X1 [Carya illinoinensis]KAG2726465.1 hypothetical protein I3760_01G114100 [Carya illinoinensis]KAG6667693.1 hypothetical protein CIPAW_01G118400 [Carya illinoinensis]KAG6731173.1 hypothetical protein I3842_01G116300 [Carya illinoinensis]KAG7995445.1 hypothetical protein I3843_01G109400 [Carya illinoinensis]
MALGHSPLDHHYQAKNGGKGSGVSSSSWERKASSQGSSHSLAPLTPGRSQPRSVARGNESPDHSAAVPKFGEWDDSNPVPTVGYTAIFDMMQQEKQVEAGKVPVGASENSHSNGYKQPDNKNSKSRCCFPWASK